jgi:ribosomal protein S18 acetylase RimI-like enzyme
LNNVVITNATQEEAKNLINELIVGAQARGTPLMWQVSPLTQPESLDQLLLDHGFALAVEESAMAADLRSLPELFLPEEVTIQRVMNRKQWDQFCRVSSEVHQIPPTTNAQLNKIGLNVGFHDNAAFIHYLASFEGNPVATASTLFANGVAGIYTVSTMENARRRGIGTAITLNALIQARRRGYQIAVLSSSDSGYQIYRRLGFYEYYKGRQFIWKPNET